MIHPVIERQALEYISDLVSGGMTDESEIRKAVVDYLMLDEQEMKEVWEKWTEGQLEG